MALPKRVAKRKGTTGNYFDDNVRSAIVAMQTCTDPVERNRLWNTVHPAALKFAEIWLNKLDRRKLLDRSEVTQSLVVLFYNKLNKFDATRGTNAYSYFNMLACNHVLLAMKGWKRRNISEVVLNDTSVLNNNATHHVADVWLYNNSQHIRDAMNAHADSYDVDPSREPLLRQKLIRIVNQPKANPHTVTVADALLKLLSENDKDWVDARRTRGQSHWSLLKQRLTVETGLSLKDVADGLAHVRLSLRRSGLFNKA